MKKSKWLYGIFSIVVIVALAIVLIFVNKDDNKNNNNPNESIETYATTLIVDLPQTIKIAVGSQVKFNNDYLTIEPSSVSNKLSINIEADQNITNGIIFENNLLIANEIGTYTITFSVPKSKLTNFTKSIKIEVVSKDQNAHLTQIKKSIIIGKAENISNLFEITVGSTFTLTTDSKLTYSNNEILANDFGDCSLEFSFIENNLEYLYCFNLTVKQIPEYVIETNVVNNLIQLDLQDNVFQIQYQVKNRDEEEIYQIVTATSEDESVVKVNDGIDQFVKVTALKVGETTITLTLNIDTAIQLEIKVIVT